MSKPRLQNQSRNTKIREKEPEGVQPLIRSDNKYAQLRKKMQQPTPDGSGCSNESVARFLLLLDPDTEIEELPLMYEAFKKELRVHE
jgi:hypothetical protein